MKRSILRILSLAIVISMVFSIPVFSAGGYQMKMTITGPTYDYDDNFNVIKNTELATVATTYEMSPIFPSSTKFLEALAQVFSRTYDVGLGSTTMHSVNEVFTRSSLHQTVAEGLAKRNNQSEWESFIAKNIAASYKIKGAGDAAETVPVSISVMQKSTSADDAITIGQVYEDTTWDHSVTFVLTRTPDEVWTYVNHNGKVFENKEYNDTYTIVVELQPASISGGGTATTPTTPTDTTTVPVTGETTVPVDVEVSGNTATIPEITEQQVEQANGTKDNVVTIDVSGLSQNVTTVELPKEAVETVTQSVDNLQIVLPNVTVTLDKDDLSGVKEETITISVTTGTEAQSTLTPAQQQTVNDTVTNPSQVVTLETNVGGGTLNVPTAEDSVPLVVNPDGSLEPLPSTYEDGVVSFQAKDGATVILRPLSYTGAIADKLITDVHDLYLKGYPDGSVKPMGNITRAEVSMAFYRLLKDKSVVGTASYTDVKDDAWYAEAVKALSSLGIVEGYEDGSFKPDQAITRAEFAAVATRFIEAKGGNVKFKDVPDDFWAKENISTAAYFGWINGYKDATFRPNNKITRAEAATIINHMLGRNADKAFADANSASLKQFTDLQDNTIWYYYTMVEATNSHDFTTVDGKETTWTGLR